MDQTPQQVPQQLPQQAFHPSSEPLTVKDWFVTLFITYIPIVGLIMLLVWAFDNTTNLNKKNFAKASLLWMLIGIVLAIIFLVWFYFRPEKKRTPVEKHATRIREKSDEPQDKIFEKMEDDGIIPVQARVYDDFTRNIYNTTIPVADVRKIRQQYDNLGRKWLFQNKWVYALNKNADGSYIPVPITETMDNPPSKLHRALYQPEVDIVFNVQPERNLLQKYGAILLFAGVCLFIMFMMVKG